MPLLKIHSTGVESGLGLWHISETEEALAFSAQQSCPEEIINKQKRLEWLAARSLVKSLLESVGLTYGGLTKDEFGKPYLKEHPHHVSLSHSYPYVAVQLDRWNEVGIDLEQPKEKLKTIAPRIFTADEVRDAGDDVVKLCIYWCAKEALYKFHGKRNILFTDHLRVMPFHLSTSGVFAGKILIDETELVVRLQYLVMMDFVLVYTSPKAD
jgi:4'-phosphopantetheinyl transferase